MGSIGEMFNSARHIMDWLTLVAGSVAKEGFPVMWMTPMGLPSVQPYRREQSFLVSTIMQNISLAESEGDLPVSSARQRSAFPPNYVHSLDSSHMLMTALKAKERGIDFISVHDSYWTHASDVDTLSDLLRDSFVELHSQPLLEDLEASFKARHPTLEFPAMPERGELDIEKVRESVYFFS